MSQIQHTNPLLFAVQWSGPQGRMRMRQEWSSPPCPGGKQQGEFGEAYAAMPLVRYEVRCEHKLANPELYRTVHRDDSEGLLEGVAMAGFVGIVRQLGDLAEYVPIIPSFSFNGSVRYSKLQEIRKFRAEPSSNNFHCPLQEIFSLELSHILSKVGRL